MSNLSVQLDTFGTPQTKVNKLLLLRLELSVASLFQLQQHTEALLGCTTRKHVTLYADKFDVDRLISNMDQSVFAGIRRLSEPVSVFKGEEKTIVTLGMATFLSSSLMEQLWRWHPPPTPVPGIAL